MTIINLILLSAKFVGYFAIIISFLVAIVAFIVTWLISEFFIPPRDHWTKSGYSILLIKLGMAGGIAVWVFIIVSQLIIGFMG
jgi:hypothetical protein